MIFLRQSTASQEIPLGRFVDSGDGNTEEISLTINASDIKLFKTGATSLASKNSGGATHIANGEYYCVLDATDTDTIGPMKVAIHVSGALAVQAWCCVLDEAVYDSLFGTTALSTLTAAGVWANGTRTLSALGFALAAGDLSTDTLTAAKLAADVSSEIATQVRTELATELARIDAAISSRLASNSTGSGFTAIPWNASWDAEVQSEVQDALDATVADSVPADGSRPSIGQGIYALYQFLTERSVSGTTVTVKKPDGSTTLMTLTLNDGTTPTSITRSA